MSNGTQTVRRLQAQPMAAASIHPECANAASPIKAIMAVGAAMWLIAIGSFFAVNAFQKQAQEDAMLSAVKQSIQDSNKLKQYLPGYREQYAASAQANQRQWVQQSAYVGQGTVAKMDMSHIASGSQQNGVQTYGARKVVGGLDMSNLVPRQEFR